MESGKRAERICCIFYLPGFALDVTNIQNEIANCNTVWDKYKNDLLTGASDPATAVPACIEELKAAGLDTVIEEAQKQVDEFFAN